ncbi:O-antigen ligase family protein [Cellulophaga sp. RHA19]|uniref:O-antigen ligase family protein n=1 Tax=Cellulophaga sp. RHA19 TaxID=1798237 RepID=UPI0012FD339D|nr:O-antigen ligase family protein [Cellulophaga sp. RHA19]
MKRFKVDYYLLLIFLLILIVFKAPSFAFLFIIPILSISYYRIIVKRDITTVLILMLSARLIMGPFIINNNLSFNILNILCNYIPIVIILGFNLISLKTLNVKKLWSLKWTLLFIVFLYFFGLFNVSYSLSVFTEEILPLSLFFIVIITNSEQSIKYEYLLNFFRYTFLACLVVYLSPHFYDQMYLLFADGIIFKKKVSDIALRVFRSIPRNTGFVFDFRIMGQLACIYLIILHYLKKRDNYWDVVLLCLVGLITFSRGPLLILILLLIGVYAPTKIRLTKKLIILTVCFFVLMVMGIFYGLNNKNIQKFVKTFNPFAKDNAISQRGIFINYALNRFSEQPFGAGIGALSSSKADVVIFAGYTNRHKEKPDKVFYHKVGDAYLALSLAEKGIIGFILFLLSLIEIFYSKRNRVSLFFLVGLMINLIGTDIPKQGFYYFVIIIIYYGLSQKKILIDNLPKIST